MVGSIGAMKNAVVHLEAANIGYDQWDRWSFFKDGKIVPNSEADCSSLCAAIAILGGYPIDISGVFYTGNMRDRFVKAGFIAIPFQGLSQIKPGDFLLNEREHVEFVYSPSQFYTAHIDENGNTHGGAAGDQTGKETSFRAPYVYPNGGWNYILRPPAPTTYEDNDVLSPDAVKQIQSAVWGFPIPSLIGKPDPKTGKLPEYHLRDYIQNMEKRQADAQASILAQGKKIDELTKVVETLVKGK